MKGTELVRGGAAELVAVVDVPADRSPYFVYLARLGTADSRRVQADALARIAALLTGGAVPASAFDWGALRYPHAAAVRSRLAERYEPRTVRRMLSALRGVLREAWRLGAMSAEDFARASDLAPVKGTTLPAAPRGRNPLPVRPLPGAARRPGCGAPGRGLRGRPSPL
jgi:hypothetical protein